MISRIFNSIRRKYESIKLRRLLINEMENFELRTYFKSKFDIEVGAYSYGCFDSRRVPRGTKIGRYCSFAPEVIIFNANHGLDFLSLHPYLYNVSLGFVAEETITRTACVFEDDVWVGYGAIILPTVRRVGRGAVIAAGSIVTKDVPPYSIVAGNPAVVKRYRFSPDIIDKIESTKWWLMEKNAFHQFVIENKELVYSPSFFFNKVTDAGGFHQLGN